MDTLQSVFTTYQFDVEVVTPVHIGMAQEKNYVRGLDYVLELEGRDATLSFLNTNEILKSLQSRPEDLQGYSLRLATGRSADIENYLRTKKLLTDRTIRRSSRVQGHPDEIRRFYSNGMGQFTLPGSSIKGAIRSILLHKLKDIRGLQVAEKDLFGEITDNLMRYIQVGDVVMSDNSIKVYSTKVFSADGNPIDNSNRGAWKHRGGKGGHREDFSETGFTFHYEALMAKSVGSLRINIGDTLPTTLRQRALKNTPNFDQLVNGKGLVDLIRSHTEQYLKKEQAYYNLFPNNDLNDLTKIKDRLDNLISRNNSIDDRNSCLLRVGAGVGFHSITGDWQLRSRDHFSDWNGREYAIMNKTRKFIFTFSEKYQNYIFYPMGFIKLTLRRPK